MRAYNFSAGPSALPLEVLEEAQKEFLDFAGTGMSVTEISHRNKKFEEIVNEGSALLRELLNIPDDYAVIFVQRPSHKAMVIGRAGATIKEIGTEARKDIQKLIGGRVHLQLFVKVKDNWAEDTELLHDLGLEED